MGHRIIIILVILHVIIAGCEITEVHPDFKDYDDGDSVVLYMEVLDIYACTPTAIGMLLQYYSVVNSIDDVVNVQHMEYYASPKDTRCELKVDSSVIDNPPQTCLADFLKTSWYSEECWYKATDHFNVVCGIQDYLKFKGDKYDLQYRWVFGYGGYMKLIDNGCPVYITTRLGENVHSCLGIGYVRSDSAFLSHGCNGEIVKFGWNTNNPMKLRIVGSMDLQIKRK